MQNGLPILRNLSYDTTRSGRATVQHVIYPLDFKDQALFTALVRAPHSSNSLKPHGLYSP